MYINAYNLRELVSSSYSLYKASQLISNLEDLWRYAQVDFPPPTRYLRFTATVGSDYQGDIAIDHIIVYDYSCGSEPTPPTPAPTAFDRSEYGRICLAMK